MRAAEHGIRSSAVVRARRVNAPRSGRRDHFPANATALQALRSERHTTPGLTPTRAAAAHCFRTRTERLAQPPPQRARGLPGHPGPSTQRALCTAFRMPGKARHQECQHQKNSTDRDNTDNYHNGLPSWRTVRLPGAPHVAAAHPHDAEHGDQAERAKRLQLSLTQPETPPTRRWSAGTGPWEAAGSTGTPCVDSVA